MSIATQEGVSIIIPVYNYAEFVAEAIDSALNQTYPNIEVVVIDDGSTDDTPHVLERYSGFARIITQDNLGLSAARNLGLREASNDLVAFLDADDRLLPNMVALLHGTLSLTGGDCALAAGSHSYIDASGRPLQKPPKGPAETADISRDQLLLHSHFSPSAVLAKKQALLAIGGFSEDYPRCEDRELWIRLAERSRIMQVPDILTEVRLHFRNMSKDADLMAECLRQVLVDAFDRLPPSPNWQSRCWASYYHDCAWMFHEAKRRWPAVANELRSLVACSSGALRRDLGAPAWFRIRALCRFLLGLQSQPQRALDD